MLQLVWRSYAVMSRSTSRRPPPFHTHAHTPILSHMLRSANKNVFVQINRRGCSSTFQHIFYEGHAVCCRWCSDGGSAPPPCKKKRGKKEKCCPHWENFHPKQEAWFGFWEASHIIDNRVWEKHVHSQTAPGGWPLPGNTTVPGEKN